MNWISCLRTMLLVTAMASIGSTSYSQTYPSKPIRFVIGFAPGTSLDAVSRLVGIEMEKKLGQPITLEFKPGANGIIGARSVMSAAPDGYTFYYGNATSFHPLFNRDNAVFAGTDFAAVGGVATAPYFFFITARRPMTTFQELAAFAKANPDVLMHGATSQTTDLIMQMLKDRTGFTSRSIPYKSTPQIVNALIVGEVDTAITNIQAFLPHIQTGRVRTLFVASPKRSPLLPNIPTSSEIGIANFEVTANYGLWAPLGTPKDVILKLNSEVAAALKNPTVVERLRSGFGMEPVGSTPEEQMRAFENETRFWSEAARMAKFTPQ